MKPLHDPLAWLIVLCVLLAIWTLAGCAPRQLRPEDRQYELTGIPCDDSLSNCGKRP